MTCETAETLLQRSLDGPLAQPERIALDSHCEGCADCCQERDAQRRLAQLAGRWAGQALASSDPSDAFTAQVLARLEAPPKRSRLSLALSLAATLLLLTALAILPDHLGNFARNLILSLDSLPHWLAVNLRALPGDAVALRHLPMQPVFVSAWISILLPLAISMNAVLCLYARQSAPRRSVS